MSGGKKSDLERHRSVQAAPSVSGLTGATSARELLQEVPVSIVFNGTSAGVMMASPCDVEDLALGFALTEGIVSGLPDIENFELVDHSDGIEARFWLTDPCADALTERRRLIAGPIGCGLCGIDSLEQALRPVPQVSAEWKIRQQDVARATQDLRSAQPLHDRTHAAHAAGFVVPGQGVVMAREDLGRHNALDKLIGALKRAQISAASGAFVMTSRLSLELVQKCAMAGSPMLIAVSAPTLRAINVAETSCITLAAFARGNDFEIFTHPQRILSSAPLSSSD
jgi:FdhD protein